MNTCRYDTGPIVAQAVVPVSPTDTPKQLAAKVLLEVGTSNVVGKAGVRRYGNLEHDGILNVVQEHRLYPHVVAALVAGRINWRADGIPVIWSAH